jgi:hypothetical protein
VTKLAAILDQIEFCAPAKMRDDPRWIDVTSLYTRGLEPHLAALHADPRTKPRIVSHVERLARLRQVLERDFHEEKITGAEKSIDVVVDTFNLVNSGGAKLSKWDLALAKKCAHWPEGRATMRTYLDQWEKERFSFTLDWLLRNTNAVATGRAEFSSLDAISIADFKQALEVSASYVSQFLDVAAGHLGLDHNRVLMGRYAVPVICRMLPSGWRPFRRFSGDRPGAVLVPPLGAVETLRRLGPNPPHLPRNGSMRGRVPEKSG